MIYVFDTSAFIVLKHFYPSAFPTLWSNLDSLARVGIIVSVREVFRELEGYNDAAFILDWAKKHKKIFAKPTNEELLIVQEILAIAHFQQLIDAKSILRGTPVADPFVMAAAKAKGGTVITQEKEKPNAAKIPNVCKHFGVHCIDLETFMTDQGWTF